MLNLKRHTDTRAPGSLSNRMRNERFKRFEALISQKAKPWKIIDIGGTPQFWRQRGWTDRGDAHITIVNITPQESAYANISFVLASALDLGRFRDNEFDVSFSNSVIEHLHTFENQKAMAREVRRVAPAYWLQTPNYWFPVEPHFHFVGWQWLPLEMRVAMLQRWRFGRRGPTGDPEAARELVEEVRLLTRSELVELFPGGAIVAEKFGAWTKSWMVHGGFAA